MAQQDLTKQPPLGYWLKHADEVITKHVNHVLSEQGFTRFHWQVLNSIYEAGTIARKDVFDTMQTFIEAHQFDDILDGFVKQGWLVERSDGDTTALMLTDAGKIKRDTIFKLQREVRRRAMRGITDQEYSRFASGISMPTHPCEYHNDPQVRFRLASEYSQPHLLDYALGKLHRLESNEGAESLSQ